MARFAREFFMRAMYFMVGIDIVIKNDARPVSGNMAGLTDITEVSIVIIVFEMTRHTGSFKLIRKRVFAMTVIAA